MADAPEEEDEDQDAAAGLETLVAEVRAIRPEWSSASIRRALAHPDVVERGWGRARPAMLAVAADPESRRRAQAIRAYITTTVFPGNRAHPGNEYIAGRPARPAAIGAIVHNTGDRPIYDVRIHWVAMNVGSQAAAEQELGTLGPQDRTPPVQRDVPDSVPAEQLVPIAYFRDTAGLGWTVTPNGTLAPVDAELAVGASLIATRAAASAYPHLARPSQLQRPSPRLTRPQPLMRDHDERHRTADRGRAPPP